MYNSDIGYKDPEKVILTLVAVMVIPGFVPRPLLRVCLGQHMVLEVQLGAVIMTKSLEISPWSSDLIIL